VAYYVCEAPMAFVDPHPTIVPAKPLEAKVVAEVPMGNVGPAKDRPCYLIDEDRSSLNTVLGRVLCSNRQEVEQTFRVSEP